MQEPHPLDVFAALGESDRYAEFSVHWRHSAAARPEGRPHFLEREAIRAAWRDCSLPGDVPDAVWKTADDVAGDPNLRALAWHLWWLLYRSPEQRHFRRLPRLSRNLGEDSPCFYLLLALDFARHLAAHHRKEGIPDGVTRETARQVACFHELHTSGTGRPGIYSEQLFWLRNYLRWTYVRLGRLEFWYKTCDGDLMVCRQGGTGEAIYLAREGLTLDVSGRAVVRAEEKTAPGVWTTVRDASPERIVGHPVAGDGRVARATVTLDAREWDCVLGLGSPVLDMHIPSGGGLTSEALEQSFRQAEVFFFERYPEAPPAAIVSLSWMFSPDLFEILSPDTNLHRVLRRLQLLPAEGKGAAPWHVFRQETFAPATAPRQTSLQRAILAWLERGQAWRDGRMVRLLPLAGGGRQKRAG